MTSMNDLVQQALSVINSHEQGSCEYNVACFTIKKAMPHPYQEQLMQLCKTGPIWDGDVLSKQARDTLLEYGLASRAINKGESGYTVANYRGHNVFTSDGEGT